MSTFTSPTLVLHWGGESEIWGTGYQNFSGVEQAIEWTKNITSGSEPYSDREPFFKKET